MTTISSMTRGFDAERLLPPEAALERYFSCVELEAPPVERVTLGDARTRILAERIVAEEAIPPMPRSAMDGFAVRAASTPATLRIVATVAIDDAAPQTIAPDECVRIPTGGALPAGADAVVPVETVTAGETHVQIERAIAAGEAVVARGADMEPGQVLLERGRRLGAPEIGVLAAAGVVDVPVYRRPLVAIVSSGDEIVPPSRRVRGGEVRDANRYAIAASLEALGAEPRHYATVRDVAGALEDELRTALRLCDAAVVSGGSSVGARDYTPHAAAALGPPGVVAHGLRVRPGKPTLFAAAGSKPIVGLPGNPLSALMMLEAVAAPIFAALAGAAPPFVELAATLREPIAVPPGWTWFVPVTLDERDATPLPLHSFATSIAARASGYVVAREPLLPGALVTVRRFLSGGRL